MPLQTNPTHTCNTDFQLLVIENDGPLIADTNYWCSDYALHGLCYLSWNAGAARLLVPDTLPTDAVIAEMTTAKYVTISEGPWVKDPTLTVLEILFDDESKSPFQITIRGDMTDRHLPDQSPQNNFVVTVWTPDGLQLTREGHFRHVDSIPCLKRLTD